MATVGRETLKIQAWRQHAYHILGISVCTLPNVANSPILKFVWWYHFNIVFLYDHVDAATPTALLYSYYKPSLADIRLAIIYLTSFPFLIMVDKSF